MWQFEVVGPGASHQLPLTEEEMMEAAGEAVVVGLAYLR